MEFSGAARPITAREIEEAAKKLDCEIAVLRAVMAVESRNSGFDAKRRPIILYEPHVFFRNLPPGSAKQKAAVAAGLAYQRWGMRPYPKGSDAQYDRLRRAAEIDKDAAFRAISVGMGQVLGENFRIAGCDSAVEMFEEAKESEAAQLRHMLNFIRARRIDDDMREKRWESFARVYNGPGQVKKYAAWLAREYAKWSKITSKPRQELTAKDLRAAGSKTIAATDSVKTAVTTIAVAGSAASGAVSDIQGTVQQAQEVVEGVKAGVSLLEIVQTYWPIILVVTATAVAAFFLWRAWRAASAAEQERVENARTGINERI
jgi:hypothetical protein